MADNNTTTTTQVVVNKEVIICPKCKKELNAANTKCPACGTILRNTPIYTERSLYLMSKEQSVVVLGLKRFLR